MRSAPTIGSSTGWSWNPCADDWESGSAFLTAYVQREGHARVPVRYLEGDYPLGAWVSNQRGRREQLTPEQIARLESMPGWSWQPFAERWEEVFAHLAAFVDREGHARVPGDHIEGDSRLGQWVGAQRSTYKEGRLGQARTKRLSVLPGWSWDIKLDAWEEGYRQISSFVEREGHARVPQDYCCEDFRLGAWVGAQRAKRERLSADQSQRLAMLPGWSWDARTDTWEEGFELLAAFAARHGSAKVPSAHEEAGFPLGKWVVFQRQQHKRRALEADRAARLAAFPGWSWDARAAAWEEGFQYLEAFVEREGQAGVKNDWIESGFQLGNWVVTQRVLRKRGELSHDREARLQALVGWSWNPRTALGKRGSNVSSPSFGGRATRMFPQHILSVIFGLGSG